jgi:hypothetical protein
VTDQMNYSPEELERAQQIVADDQAKRAAAAAEKRAAYTKAAQDLTAMPEWEAVSAKIGNMVETLEDDGQISIHVTALSAVMQRLQEAVVPRSAITNEQV